MRERPGHGLHLAHADLFDHEPLGVDDQRRIGRTAWLPAEVQNHGSLDDPAIEIDGQVEDDLVDADLLGVAVRVRVGPVEARSGSLARKRGGSVIPSSTTQNANDPTMTVVATFIMMLQGDVEQGRRTLILTCP